MLDWRLLAFSVPTLFVTYQALAKILPKGASVFLVNAYASLVGVFIMLSLHLLTRTDKSIQLPAKTLWIAIGIGLLISMGNYGIIKAYSLGAPQSLFTLFFYVSLIVYGIILGFLVWHERFHPAQILGMTLAIIGILIVFRFKR